MNFLGSIAEVKTVWSLIDIVLASIVIPHMTALILYAYKNPNAIPLDLKEEEGPSQDGAKKGFRSIMSF